VSLDTPAHASAQRRPRHGLRREDQHKDGSGVDWTPTALALAEAGEGLTLAYYTDWPTSCWITTLSGMVFFGGTLVRDASPQTGANPEKDNPLPTQPDRREQRGSGSGCDARRLSTGRSIRA
jgi:hypothetical protein